MVLIHGVEVYFSEWRIFYQLLVRGIVNLSKISLILLKCLGKFTGENMIINLRTFITSKPRITYIGKIHWRAKIFINRKHKPFRFLIIKMCLFLRLQYSLCIFICIIHNRLIKSYLLWLCIKISELKVWGSNFFKIIKSFYVVITLIIKSIICEEKYTYIQK